MLQINTKSKLKYRRLFFDKDNPGINKLIRILALVIATSMIYLIESIEKQHLYETAKGISELTQSDNETFQKKDQQELMFQAQGQQYYQSSSFLRCSRMRTRKDKFFNMDNLEIVNNEKLRPQGTWISRLFQMASAQEVLPSIIDFSREQQQSESSSTYEVFTNIETFNTKIEESRMLQTTPAPQPVIGTNLAITLSSPNCNTYQIDWSYTFPSGTSAYTDLDIVTYGTGTWNIQVANALNRNPSSHQVLYSTLSPSFGYYLGLDVQFRIRFRNSAFLFSPYYIGTLTNMLKQPPTAPVSITFSQTMTSFTISWPALASTWTSTGSVIGTGNLPVTYQVQRSTTAAGSYANIPVMATTTGTQLQFTLPDTTNYNYGSIWHYKVGAINSCTTFYIYSAAFVYTMLGGAPIAPNTPTLSSNFDAILRIDWNQLVTDTEQNYRAITQYRVYSRLSLSNTPLLLATITNPSLTFWEQWGGKSPLNYLWGSTVYFSVSAFNGAEGLKSGDLAVQMPRVPQVQPTLTLVAKTMTKLDFSWNLITNDNEKGLLSISGYQLEGNINSLFTSTTILNVTLVSSASSYSFFRSSFTYAPNTIYFFRVYGINAAGFGAMASNTAVLTPTVPIKMAPPTVSLINPLNIVINWIQLTTLADIGFEQITNYYIQKCVGATCTIMTQSYGFASTAVTFSETFTQAQAIAQQGQIWRYQVFACNFNGNGTASDYLTINVDNVPQSMTTVTLTCVEVLPFSMKFSWTALATTNNGGDPVTFYGLEYSVGGSTFTQLNFDFANLYQDYTYGVQVAFIPATVYSFRLKAKNGVDYSNTFATTTCTSLNVPTGMTALSYGAVTPKSIVVNWNELTDLNLNGRDNPIFYQLEWYNQGVSPMRWDILTFQNIHGKVLTFTHTRSTVFPSGSSQQYRVVAQNNMGIGGISAYSPTLSIPADQVPIRMNNPTLVGVTPNSISLTWSPISLASDTGGDDVIFYHLKWKGTPLTNYPTDTMILTAFTHTLSSGIFSSGSKQNYQVCAQNGVGEGNCGTIEVFADKVPQACNSPTIALADIDPQRIIINWTPISTTDNGGDVVIFYLLEWNQGPSLNTFVPLNTYSSGMAVPIQQVHIPSAILTSGAPYIYRISAKNGVGYGATCETTMYADLVPQACSTPAVAIENIKPQQITVTWSTISPLQNGGDSVIFYLLEWDQGLGDTVEGNFIPLNTYTSGMTVPTSYVHNTPSILNSGMAYIYRLTAKNGVGFSLSKCSYIMNADLVPQVCTNPIITLDDIMPTQVTISWLDIPEASNGGDAVIFYELQWDGGSGSTFTPLNSYTTGMVIPKKYVHNLGYILTSGAPYIYRLRAKNGVGYSLLYCNLQINADQVPLACTNPIITEANILPQKVSISWVNIDVTQNGGDAVIYYQLEWDQGKNAWENLNSYTSNMPVPFQYIHNTPSILNSGAPYVYRLTAKNGVGFSAVQCKTTINADLVPQACTSPIIPLVNIYPKEVRITWDQIIESQNGRDPVIFYLLEWDQGKSDWQQLNSYTTNMAVPTSFNHIPPSILNSGAPYVYRLTPKNGVDYSLLQCTTTIYADLVPQACNPPIILEADVKPQKVTINWVDISVDDNGRDPIIFYLLEWDQGKNNWVPLNSYTTNMAIPLKYEHVPAAILTSGMTIHYRLTAKNGVNYGKVSTETPVLCDAVPRKMDTPMVSMIRFNKIDLYWNLLTTDSDVGRDPILYYHIEFFDRPCYAPNAVVACTTTFDAVDGTWIDLMSTVTTITNFKVHSATTIFSAGKYYNYRVRAKNGVGWGDYSDILDVLTPVRPQFMNKPSVDYINPQAIKISWEQFTNSSTDFTDNQGRDLITYYTIEVDPDTGTFVPLNPTGPIIATYTHTSPSAPFKNNTIFKYRVAASNAMGMGAYSEELHITTDTVPEEVQNLLMVSVQPKIIKIKWDDLITDTQIGRDGIKHYKLEYHDNKASTNVWTTLTSSSVAYVTEFTHTVSSPFPANIDQSPHYVKYRVSALNGVGYGITTELYVLTDTFPIQMSKVYIADPTASMLDITWTQLSTQDIDTGRDPVIHYQVQWIQSSFTNNQWQTITTYPDLSQNVKVLDTNSYWLDNTQFKVRVAAQNGVGLGIYSDYELVTTDDVPNRLKRMKMPVENPLTNATQIMIDWEDLTDPLDTGRDPVTYYRIYWDQGKNQWDEQNVPSNARVTTFLWNSGIKNGTTYKFKIRPQNLVGDSSSFDSPILSVIPSSPPDKMDKITITLISSDVSVKLAWNYPQDNGDSVDEYLIEIRGKNSEFYTSLATCDGRNPTIVAQRFCYIPMNTLRNEPFNLLKGDKIVARANSRNIKGFNVSMSDTIDAQFTQVIEVEPNAPSAPVRGSNTDHNVLHVTWPSISDFSVASGGLTSRITSYEIQRNLGNSSADPNVDTWVSLQGFSSNSTSTQVQTSSSIVGGTTYRARVRAYNKFGWGAWSTVTEIISAKVPDATSWITTANSTTDFFLKWQEPFNRGLAIQRYYITIMKKGGNVNQASSYFASPDCDGSNPLINSTQSCLIPMASLRGNPWFWALNDKITVRIWAQTPMGQGNFYQMNSTTSGNNAAIQTQPQTPTTTVTNNLAITTDLRIRISWAALPTIDSWGGIQITSYEVYWMDPNNEYDLFYTDTPPFQFNYLHTKTNPLDFSVTSARHIVPGTLYKFKYRAINIHGIGSFSAESSIYASTIPDKLAPPITSLQNTTVTIVWAVTPNDHAQAVTKYAIRFRTSSGSYIEDSGCPGANPTVVSSLTCPMPMTKFTSAPFNLGIDTLIQVTVEAFNVMGWSGQSNPNTIGVLAKRQPQAAPTNLARGVNTGKNLIHLTWVGLSTNTQTGGQPVDYRIYYDRATNQATWSVLLTSTNNATVYQEQNSVIYKTGNLYSFRVQAWNDFGLGIVNSSIFGVWTAIPPTGMAAPTSSLAYNSYTEEDDIIVIDWEPPIDNGGLVVSYQVDIRAKSGNFLAVSMMTECFENNNGITDYKMPSIPTADLGTRCTVMITNLKSKYNLLVGDTVVARVTASHAVGSVTSNPGGTAVLPIVACFRTTFPRIVGGSNQDTMITCMDADDTGQIVIGGHTQDRNLLEGKTLAYTLPIAVYIAKGNFYAWAKYLQTTDTSNTMEFTSASDITFRWDGEKVAIALDKMNYDISYLIVVLNKDGTLYGAYRENSQARGKVLADGMIFDSSNMITVAVGFAPTGQSNRRQAVLNRFPVTQTAAGTFLTQFYLVGGANTVNMISQSFALQRIRGDTSSFYLSALITDNSGIRRSILAKTLFGTGIFQRYYVHAPGTDYNSDSSVAVIKRMSLEENDLTGQHFISACIMSQDNYRIHFGEFIFTGSTSQSQTVLTPTQLAVYNTYNCLGTFSRIQGILYFLYNYRKDTNPLNHMLILGRVTVSTRRLDELNIVSHHGQNEYGGAKFIHMSRIYYFGRSNRIHRGDTITNQPLNQGWINIFDPLEQPYSCNPTTQSFTIPATQISLDQVLVAQMDWRLTGLTSTTGFANSVSRTMRSLGTITGLNNLNLAEPLTNNTWCPIVTSGGGAPTITSPVIPNQIFTYNPDISGSQTQSFQFNPITVSRFCPDTVIYNYTYLWNTSKALPSFITLKEDDNRYVYDVSTTAHVGTYFVMLMSALGNNISSNVIFRSQVVSPCINNPVAIPNIPVPIYDISEWSPKHFDLNWVVTNSTKSCGSVYQIFELLNYTTGGPIDPNIYQIVNQTSGIQRIQIWTQSIPYAKLWTDLLVNSYLQGDFVASYVFTVNITNDCAPTVITPQVMPNWIYYTGRDSIDLAFEWSETIGKCGPISYTLRDYQISNSTRNNTLDPTIFTTPSVPGTNNTIKIFTADESKVGTYRIRVFASLGVGGYKQSSTIFTLNIIRDPCAYYGFTLPFIDDLTLWINQTDQVVQIPFFQMSDPSWICNFTYIFTTALNTALDPIFVKKEVVKQGTNPNITLVTTDKTKIELSPYTIRVRGWPTRQPSNVAQSLTFRVYIAYFDRTDCKPGKFYNDLTEKCESCTSPCSQCKTTASTCTWCIDGFIYVDATNQCIPRSSSCPQGVKDPYLSICRKCREFCRTCIDYNTCTQCIPNYSLANKKCYPPRSCPEGYTYNGVDCTKCSENCASCISPTQCHYCMETFYLDTTTNQCLQTCPVGYYADVQSRVCMVCAPQCRTCVNNNYTCTSCKDLVVGGVTTFTYLFGKSCVDRCPYLQYYQNHNNRSCDPCDPQCKICVNAINDCIVCNDKSVISGRSCLNSCPVKSYITEIGTCFPCDSSCENCTGAMNSMCSLCSPGNFLTQTTCDSKCNPPLYPDGPSRSCQLCPYYCNQCTMATDCQKCKIGYRQVPNSCEGEMFARFNGSVQLNMTMDSSLTNFNPTEMTVELWFKIDNPLSSSVDVILGASPYKLRKKANVAQVQLSFDVLQYCDSFNLKANQWYHYAFALSETTGSLNCYLTGEKLSTGLNSVSLITADILSFRELTFGGSQDLKRAENRFKGYIKEFRWWKTARSYFQINNFKDISIATPPQEMLAYWRLDEFRTNNTAFRDSVKGTLTTPSAPWTLAMIMELREIYLKICPEGTYGVFNDSSNMAECIPCHSSCKNCNGGTNTSCTDCKSQFRLIEAEQTCIPEGPCPNGYYSDANRKCQPCHPYCETCEFTPTQCPKCKPKYFKQGFGCLDKCLRGLYGNYKTQSCVPNPLVTSLFPLDGVVYQYGSFIDLYATFEVLNGEDKTTYSYGWIISQLSSDVDLAKDAAKPYFDTDITRVHLDNNILEPNKYYNITFYVKGKDTYYNGMSASLYNIIFIGIPPKNGRCVVTPSQGIASVTTFKISSLGWVDGDEGGITDYNFFYSLDKGDSYVPIKTQNSRLPSIQMIFDPIFVSLSAQIKCSVKSIKGFTAFVETSFVLLKKQSANAKTELGKLNVSKVTDEKDAVRLSSQISQIAQNLGQIKPVDSKSFDVKITPEKCTQATCSYSGQCIFNEFNKKYYCRCNPGYAGVNCTFKNATDLELIRNQTLALCRLYNPMSLSGRNQFDYQFLDMVTTNLDLMTDDIHDSIFDILSVQVNKLVNSRRNIGDNKDVTQNMNIISNMLEYQVHNSFVMNMTNGWKNVSDPAAKSQKMLEDFNRAVSLINLIKNQTLYRLSNLQTEIQVQTRMISFRQVLQNSDSILSMPATNNIKRQQQTYVKISPANFIGSSVSLSDKFIAQITEFAMNPYQINNTDNVAANIIEVDLFNYTRTVDGGSIVNKIDVKNLSVPIEFSFPVSDNQNLTDFIKTYNTLSNFKYSDVLKKDQMLRKSNLSCVYWDNRNSNWSKEGCQLQDVDKNHIKCNCTHLSSFTILFATPKLTIDAPLLENTTISAKSEVRRNISLSDIIKWPLDAYFANLKKLWQHNRPSFISFVINPGFAVLILFWAMYFSSLIYYSGQDDQRRFKMTKQQNRDDLAEQNDNDVQNVDFVVKDLIVKDFLKENGKFIKKEALRLNQPGLIQKPSRPPQIKIYEKLSKDEQKKYRKRARKKVFGMPSGLCARAKRIYDITMKHNTKNPNAKMSFFNEVLKNNLWIGLIAKTSKIAPRHVRLLLMYFYSSLHITLLTIIFAFQLQEAISDQALFQVVVIAGALIPAVWVITIPVALILRMPLHLRQLMAGVRTKKINKAFQVVDQHMGWRYAVGYFICLTMFFIMTVVVLIFIIFYPSDYVMGWFFSVLLVYIFDLLVFTFLLAAFQMVMIILSTKVKCFYNVWAAVEIFRYVKNLRG